MSGVLNMLCDLKMHPDDAVLLRAVPIDAGPGASFFLIELLLGQPSSTTVKATCDSTLWVSPCTKCLA
jgi:hypothetical protein